MQRSLHVKGLFCRFRKRLIVAATKICFRPYLTLHTFPVAVQTVVSVVQFIPQILYNFYTRSRVEYAWWYVLPLDVENPTNTCTHLWRKTWFSQSKTYITMCNILLGLLWKFKFDNFTKWLDDLWIFCLITSIQTIYVHCRKI